MYVIQTIKNGPSERVGLLAGDKIVTVNDTVIAGVKMERADIMSRLRGAKGSNVKIGVVRKGIDRILEFNITRDDISTETVDVAYMIDKNNGYIRITSFGAKTHDEFATKLDSLKALGMKNLIIDLEGNGGGYLSAAVEIASELIDENKLVVYTEGKSNPRTDYLSRGNGRFLKGNVVVIVDETSASAAEILSGAIQDWDRGVVVGRRTFGKGLVQRPIDLPDGSMIRLTVARYYTPAGRCIQKPYESIEKYNDDLIERYNSGEMMSADSIHFPDSLKTKTLKLGRTVYGGGGIMPDYFVPVDTTLYTQYHRDLSNKGILLKVHYQLIDTHRQEWKEAYRNYPDFNREFEVSEAMMQQLIEEGKKAGVEYNEEQYRKSAPLMKLQLKALIARDLWEMNEYFRIMNEEDASVMKAVELLQKGKK